MKEKYLPYIKIALPFVVIAAVMIFIAWCPARRSCQLAVDGKTAEARELYENSVRDSGFESTLLRFLVPRSAEAVYASYESGALDFGETSDILKTLSYLETPLNNADRLLDMAESSFRSQEALSGGRKYASDGDYREAMLTFRMVRDTDEGYEEASRLAEEMGEKYADEVIASVGAPETEEEYLRAAALIEDALEVLPGDEELKDAQQVLNASFSVFVKTSVIPRARAYMQDGYYKEAIDILDKALSYCEGDMDLKALRVEAVTLYEEFVSSQFAIYVDNYDKEGAAELLEKAQEDIPGDSVFEELEKSLGA